jgi:hypothetical protein
MRRCLKAVEQAFGDPTLKQMEVYGRYLHNLSAACIIGGITVFYSTSYTAFDVLKLFTAGVLLFLAGAVLSKGA